MHGSVPALWAHAPIDSGTAPNARSHHRDNSALANARPGQAQHRGVELGAAQTQAPCGVWSGPVRCRLRRACPGGRWPATRHSCESCADHLSHSRWALNCALYCRRAGRSVGVVFAMVSTIFIVHTISSTQPRLNMCWPIGYQATTPLQASTSRLFYRFRPYRRCRCRALPACPTSNPAIAQSVCQ